MAKKKTKKETTVEEVVTPVVENAPVVEIEEAPLTAEEVKALEERAKGILKGLTSK